MKLNIEIDPSNASDVTEAVELLIRLTGELTVTPITKAKKAPEKEKTTPKADPELSEYTVDDIRAEVSKLIKDGKRVGVKELLKKFEADTVTKLDESNFADFMVAAAAL